MSDDSTPLGPGVEPIRQVQLLMLFVLALPADARIGKLIRLALDADPGALTTRSDPIDDLHPNAVKKWFETYLHPDQATKEERMVIDWQADSDNMERAVTELRDVEALTGVRLVGTTEPASATA